MLSKKKQPRKRFLIELNMRKRNDCSKYPSNGNIMPHVDYIAKNSIIHLNEYEILGDFNSGIDDSPMKTFLRNV